MKRADQSRKIFFAFLFTIFLPQLSIASTSKKAGEGGDEVVICKKVLASELKEKLVRGVIELVREDGVVPTIRDLADHLKLEVAVIKDFFSKSGNPTEVRDLIRAARTEDDEILDGLRKKMLKFAEAYLKDTYKIPDEKLLRQAMHVASNSDLELLYGDVDSLLEDLIQAESSVVTVVRNKVMSTYARLAKSTGRLPFDFELFAELGASKDNLIFERKKSGKEDVRAGLFADINELKGRAKQKHAAAFRSVVDLDQFYTPERIEAMMKAIQLRKRLIITTAIAGTPVDKNLFKSLLNYAEKNDAEILVIPINMVTEDLDPVLLDTPKVHVLIDAVRLTPWLSIDNVRLMGKLLNPLAGLRRLGRRGETKIVGAPRLDVDTVATTDNELRNQQLFAPGCLNGPDSYNAKHFVGLRTDRLAKSMHKMGALLLERGESGGRYGSSQMMGEFHLRHLEYRAIDRPGDIPWKQEEKGIFDLDRFYTENEVRPMAPAAMVLGDLHVASIDPRVVSSLKQTIERLKPRTIILHDFFDGMAISHHELDHPFSLIDKARQGKLNLERELSDAAGFINSLLAIDPNMNIVVVKSNHDHWLYRWLEDGRVFAQQPENKDIAFELSAVVSSRSGKPMVDRHGKGVGITRDPIEYALINGVRNNPVSGQKGSSVVDDPRRVTFLKRGEVYRIGDRIGYQVNAGSHGDEGANGARGGNAASMEIGGGEMVVGHRHLEQERKGGAVVIGSFMPPRIAYNTGGFSNWGSSFALVSPLGHKQVMQFRGGKWFLDNPNAREVESPQFFAPEYPVRVESPLTAPNAGGMDQYQSGGAARRR